MNKKVKLLNAAVAGLMAASGASAILSSAQAAEPAKCYGVNTCKAQGECGGKGHACAGHNSCKGAGWVKKDPEECKKLGGSLEEPQAKAEPAKEEPKKEEPKKEAPKKAPKKG